MSICGSEIGLMIKKQKVGINSQFSELKEVNNGALQGSVLGQVLFKIFVSDLEKGISSKMAKFANDIRLFRMVKAKVDCEELQKFVIKLSKWATKGQMKFNVDKHEVMHMG